jgi:hypothetical protein
MTRKHDLEFKRQRARDRKAKHQKLEQEPIVISDSEEDENDEGFVRVPRYVKIELFRVLGSFQASPTHGVIISDRLRDPRREPLDSYIHTIRDQAHSIQDLCVSLGTVDTPLSEANRASFRVFADALEGFAHRVREAVADPAPEHLV